MPEREDLYRILQVDPAANPLVIQAAYRVLARIFHPDMEGDDGQMKRINHAWSVLGDPRSRAEYDRQRAGRHLDPRPAAEPPPRPEQHAARAGSDEHAGPPPGHPSGPVMKYGRYEGWSLGEIARVDRPFLEWLGRVPAGRQMREQIEAALRQASASTTFAGRRTADPGGARVHTWSSIRRPGTRA